MDLRKFSFLLPRDGELRKTLPQLLDELRQVGDEGIAKETLRRYFTAVDIDKLEEQPLEILLRVAEALLNAGLTDEADRLTSVMLKRFPAEAQTIMLRARVMRIKGDESQAIRVIENSLQDLPDEGSLYLELGKIFVNTGECDRALFSLKKAVENDPGLMEAYDLLISMDDEESWKARKAFALLDQGDLESAEKLISNSEEVRSPLMLLAMAEVSRTAGDIYTARELIKRVVDIVETDHEDREIVLEIAHRLAKSGLFEESIQLYEHIITHDPSNPQAWYGLSNAFFHMGRYENSLEAIQKALDADPDFDDARIMLVKDLCALRRGKEAIFEAKKILESHDGNLPDDLLEVLIRYLPGVETGEIIDRVIESRGESPSPRLLAMKVKNILAQGRAEDAMSQLGQIIKTYPQNSDLRHMRAELHLARGNVKKARHEVESILSRNPHHLPSLHTLLDILKAEESYPEMLQTADRILAIAPTEVDVIQDKAIALDAIGRSEEAVEAFRQALLWGTSQTQQVNDVIAAMLDGGRHHDALSLSEVVLDRQDHDSMFWRLRGNALYSLGHYEDAEDAYNTGLGIAPDDAWLWYSRAMCLENLGRFREAVDCYDRAIVRDLENIDFWMGKAACLEKLKLYKEASKCYDQVLQLQPGHRYALLSKALGLIKMHRYEEAAYYFNRANRITHGNPKILRYLKECQKILGNHEEVVEVCRDLLRIEPDNVNHMVDMATSLQALGDDGEALKWLDKALEFRPGDKELIDMKRKSVQRSGNIEALQKLLQDILKANPHDKEARVELSRILCEKGEYADALRLIEDLPETVSDASVQALKGRSLMALGRNEEAINAYTESLELRPNHIPTLNAMANLLESIGKLDEAMEYIDRSLALDPSNLRSRLTKARTLIRYGRKTEAKEILHSICDAHPKDGKIWVEIAEMAEGLGDLELSLLAISKAIEKGVDGLHLRLAEKQILVGDEKSAMENLREAVKEEPSSPRAWSLLGQLQARSALWQEALVSLQKALRLNPEDRDAQLALADAEAAVGKSSKALKSYEKAFRMDRNDPLPLRRKARLQMELGRHEDALMTYQSILQMLPGDDEAREGVERIKRLKAELAGRPPSQ